MFSWKSVFNFANKALILKDCHVEVSLLLILMWGGCLCDKLDTGTMGCMSCH